MLKAKDVKVVILGDAGVGKSSILLRFVTNEFKTFYESTLGAAFMAKMIIYKDQPIKFQIWDTAGQEKYHSLAPLYYKVLALVGNKVDLLDQEAVNYDEAANYAKDLGAIFKLTSAKENKGIEDLFINIAEGLENLQKESKIGGNKKLDEKFKPTHDDKCNC